MRASRAALRRGRDGVTNAGTDFGADADVFLSVAGYALERATCSMIRIASPTPSSARIRVPKAAAARRIAGLSAAWMATAKFPAVRVRRSIGGGPAPSASTRAAQKG